MGIIIRTVFNNQNWMKSCTNADRDRRLFQCHDAVVNISYKVNKKGICKAKCWEKRLCSEYSWYSKIGNFGPRATGKAYFIYRDIDNSLVLWGKSKIKNVEDNKIDFNPFKPFSQKKRIENLSFNDLRQLGVPTWGAGTFRYIGEDTETRLDSLIRTKEQLFEDAALEYFDVEGKKQLRNHLIKERSARLVKKFKGSLIDFSCVICGFSFEDIYGEIGKQFIEAHHTKPIAGLDVETKTSISDLIAVCSNCHRMLHRTQPPLSKMKLKKIMSKKQ